MVTDLQRDLRQGINIYLSPGDDIVERIRAIR